MITRSPGFRGVYMVRDDREGSRAAVVTLFDGKRHAEACHDRAVELLKEGLPHVTIVRVVQGRSVILRTAAGEPTGKGVRAGPNHPIGDHPSVPPYIGAII
jgi:hypothetical protein